MKITNNYQKNHVFLNYSLFVSWCLLSPGVDLELEYLRKKSENVKTCFGDLRRNPKKLSMKETEVKNLMALLMNESFSREGFIVDKQTNNKTEIFWFKSG